MFWKMHNPAFHSGQSHFLLNSSHFHKCPQGEKSNGDSPHSTWVIESEKTLEDPVPTASKTSPAIWLQPLNLLWTCFFHPFPASLLCGLFFPYPLPYFWPSLSLLWATAKAKEYWLTFRPLDSPFPCHLLLSPEFSLTQVSSHYSPVQFQFLSSPCLRKALSSWACPATLPWTTCQGSPIAHPPRGRLPWTFCHCPPFPCFNYLLPSILPRIPLP